MFPYSNTSSLPNITLIDPSCGQGSIFRMLAFQLYDAQALLRVKLGRAQLELSHGFLPTPPPIYDEARPQTGAYYWLQYGGETSVQSPCFEAVRSESLEEWQRWWRLDRIRFARLHEIISLLKQSYLWVRHLISLLVDRLTRPLFPYQLVLRERAWSLLHGSHPPRQDAGIFQPAFAEPGRVCEPAC